MSQWIHRTYFFVMKKIQTITSAANPVIRFTHALIHTRGRAAKEGLFAVEGVRLAEMAVSSNWNIHHVLVTEQGINSTRARKLFTQLCAADVPIYCVSDTIFRTISETDAPQGILLVMERKIQDDGTLYEHTYTVGAAAPLYIALDRIQDPGNVGTILRTADAVGASGVILLRGTADAYSGKVVRATMGSLFHVPFITDIMEEELIRFSRQRELALYVTVCHSMSCTYFSVDLCRPCILVFGNEANGVSDPLIAAGQGIHIPMYGGAESLNVSVAASAVLYEAMRQRRYA